MDPNPGHPRGEDRDALPGHRLRLGSLDPRAQRDVGRVLPCLSLPRSSSASCLGAFIPQTLKLLNQLLSLKEPKTHTTEFFPMAPEVKMANGARI